MTVALLQLGTFLACFAASFYCLSALKFETFYRHPDRQRSVVLLFLLSLSLAWLSSQAILSLTIYNGF